MRSGDCMRPGRLRQRGFGYLLVLFALAAIGLLLAGAGQVWHSTAQRGKEAELLFVGNQFRQAIAAYYHASPQAVKMYPLGLEELLEDPRFPTPRRHLRRIYRDPMTGGFEWGLVRSGGRIVGVHSLHPGAPMKTAFSARDAGFSDAARYDQWVFMNDGAAGVATPAILPLPVPETASGNVQGKP